MNKQTKTLCLHSEGHAFEAISWNTNFPPHSPFLFDMEVKVTNIIFNHFWSNLGLNNTEKWIIMYQKLKPHRRWILPLFSG